MSESVHTGPIIFSNSTARNHFVENGEVLTARTSHRTTGDTWWRKSRTGPKQGDCHVEELIAIPAPLADDLRELEHEKSGFKNWLAWWDAIVELNGGEKPTAIWVYRVTQGHKGTD